MYILYLNIYIFIQFFFVREYYWIYKQQTTSPAAIKHGWNCWFSWNPFSLVMTICGPKRVFIFSPVLGWIPFFSGMRRAEGCPFSGVWGLIHVFGCRVACRAVVAFCSTFMGSHFKYWESLWKIIQWIGMDWFKGSSTLW